MSEQKAEDRNWQLRPLLPVPPQGPRLIPPLPTPPQRSLPRQVHVAAACDTCRKQKAKCSGGRPACRRCVQRQIKCEYTTRPGETSSQALKRKYGHLQDRAAQNEEVLELLKNLPERESQAVLQRIRAGTDIATILNHVQAGDLLLQLAVQPETRFRYDFPYRSDMPQDFLPNNPYLDSFIYDVTFPYPSAQSSKLPVSSPVASLGSEEYRSLYLKPFHAAEVMDPRLTDAKPSQWTTVCDDDALMRALLAVFLRCEFHFTAAFQKDYFLEDMAAQRNDFCSSLLVNITLAYACVCYPKFSDRAEYWNPHTLVYRFLAEAKRIWELEAAAARITTIQAGILFSVFHNLSGLDEIGQAYRIQAVALAHKLRLFDGPGAEKSERLRRGRAYTAWALLVAFSFMLAPLIIKTPEEPLPDLSEDVQWYGEIWVKYPMNRRLSPLYFPQVFRARCQFRIIMNDFCYTAYSKGSGVTLTKANQLRSQLEAWYDGLPGPLQPKTIVLPGHLQLHIYYHNLILSIYEPLLDTKTDQTPSPQQIVADANKYLQTLVRLYYLRHGFDYMDLFITVPLIHTGFTCIDAINEHTPAATLEALRSTLILVAKGLHSQRKNCYLAEALFRVIRGRMRPQEASLLKNMVNLEEKESEEKLTAMQVVRSQWPVIVVRKKEELGSHILTNLVENYAHLNLQEVEEAAKSDE
ncbi:hypothetical protein GQ53DRAFT_638658 [Thozetella sp. PMI_491]|nr:hypothetical protein GQ53DRAFT_638658 [Thozetella sp. PMI_491]